MRRSMMRKVLSTMIATVFLMSMLSMNAYAATTQLVKDGEVLNYGFINAGEAKDGTIQGPGNWTQLNLGDMAVTAPYLHIVMAATGDTAGAQIGVSDTYTFKLADMGITLTEEFQDVVLPVEENGITMLSWVNFMGLDGGVSVYTIKEAFLSTDANSTLKADVKATLSSVENTVVTEPSVPKTGESNITFVFVAAMMALSVTGLFLLKKDRKVTN